MSCQLINYVHQALWHERAAGVDAGAFFQRFLEQDVEFRRTIEPFLALQEALSVPQFSWNCHLIKHRAARWRHCWKARVNVYAK